MYLDFYGFSETPFSLSPNPRFIFYSKPHKEAFALLLYGIDRHYGFIQLTGEVGTGKTTILRTLLSQLDEEKYRTALIFNPLMTAVDLMAAINREFGIPCESGNSAELLEELNRFLLEENSAGRIVVLIIDEAQNLSPELLEQVRLISNLETDTEKLIQIILAGQPELAQMLEKQELRQINQRIALRYHLRPLDGEDTEGYIEHRLRMAGARGGALFTRWAVRWLYHYSRGTPRLINILCDRALLVAYTFDKRKITARTVALAFRDVMLKPALSFMPAIGKRGVFALIAALMVLLSCIYLSHERNSRDAVPVPMSSERPQSAIPAKPVVGKEKIHVPLTAKPIIAPEVKTAASNVVAPQTTQPTAAKSITLPTISKNTAPRAPAATIEQPPPERPPAVELFPQGPRKTAVQAFNALASLLRTAPISRLGDRSPLISQIKGEASKRGLELDRFSGGLDKLLRLNVPALLDISQQGGKENCLVALTGSSGGRISIYPPISGRSSFSKKEIDRLWSGRSYILWRNAEKIVLPLRKGDSGSSVIRLQILLQAAGTGTLEVNGVYDENTVQSVREFQSSRRINASGRVGPVTLIHLYRAVTEPSSRGHAASAKEGGA
jgi:general secretion pathway protein A